jgi:hypothetical protein
MDGIYGVLCRSPKFRSSFRGPSQVYNIMENSLQFIRKRFNLSDRIFRNIFTETLTSQWNVILPSLPKANMYFKKVKKELLKLNIVIVNSDKNLGLVLVDKKVLFLREVQALLKGPYELVISSNSTSYDSLMNLFQEFLRDISKFPESIRERIKSNVNLKLLKFPRFYGMPKIHKDPWSIRTIFAAHSWITTRLSSYLHSVYQDWLTLFKSQNRSHIVNSTKEFLQHWERFAPTENVTFRRNQETTIYCVTADVEELYTNLKHSLILEAIQYFGKYLALSSQELSYLLNLTQILFKYAYFNHDDRLYMQKDGIPMGTNAGPTLANLTLLYFGFFSSVQANYLFCRYIDDLFFAIRAEEPNAIRTWNNIASRLFPPRSGLSLKITGQGTRVSFLDVDVNTEKGTLSLYRKPMFSFNYVSARSKHPRHSLLSFVRNEYYRIMLICNNPCDYYINATEFRNKLLQLHYSIQDISIPAFSLSDRSFLLYREPQRSSSTTRNLWIPWPYEARGQLKPIMEVIKHRTSLHRKLDTRSLREAITLNLNILEECRP